MALMNRNYLAFMLVSLTVFVTLTTCFSSEDTLAEKVEQLTEWSLKKPVIRMNTDKFKHFVKSAPRNYTIVVMLTALSPHRDCQICRPANDEYQIIAQSWRYSAQFSNKLFFAMVDFDEASDVFKMLNTASAPQFILFGRKGKPKAGDNFDISRVGFSAEQMAKWINDRTEINIKIFRPPNYSGLLLIIMIVSMFGSILYVKRDNLDFLYNKTSWSLIVICGILIFISGQMWNQIRGPPLVHRNPQTGQVGFFAGGHGYQFVAETYIIFALYGLIVAGMIMLNEAPKYLNQATTKKDLWSTSTGNEITILLMCLLSLTVF